MHRPSCLTAVTLLAVVTLVSTAGSRLRAEASAAAPQATSTAASDTTVNGGALFTTYCATCHEGPGANPQAPMLLSEFFIPISCAKNKILILTVGANDRP